MQRFLPKLDQDLDILFTRDFKAVILFAFRCFDEVGHCTKNVNAFSGVVNGQLDITPLSP